MWPKRNEALNRTVEGEALVEDLYREALRRWLPQARAEMVPTLTAAALSPDPGAAASAQSAWDRIAAEVIVAGLGLLWATSFVGAALGMGVPLPPMPPPRRRRPDDDLDSAAVRIVAAHTGMTRAEVVNAGLRVADDPASREARDAYVDGQREQVARVPAQVSQITLGVIDEVPADFSVEQTRTAVEDVLRPTSTEIAAMTRQEGRQAAGAMNSAVLTAAAASEDELDKIWIATLDGATRPTHWAADGQRAPLNGTFLVGGEHLAYPGDPTASPAERINCRCRVGLLGPGEALPDEVDRHTEREGVESSTERRREGRSQGEEIERRNRAGNVRARDDREGIGRVASGQEDTMTVTDPVTGYRTFTDAVLAYTGRSSSDGRVLAHDIKMAFRDFPQPIMWTRQRTENHLEAYTVGRLESGRIDGDRVLGSGYLLNTAEADEAAEQIAHGVTGPSLDLADADWHLATADGEELSMEDMWDSDPTVKVYQTITAAETIGVTLVATPAFGSTSFALNDVREPRDVGLVAAAGDRYVPRVYAAGLFADPHLPGPTLPTLGEDGRVYGHLACFGQCHRSVQSDCVIAPRSPSGYQHFHTSPAVHLDDGTRLPVGRLTVGIGHAADTLRPVPAMAHYDNAGTCFALVRVGEDAHGVWFSGVPAPWATAGQVEQGLSAPLSGDWRNFGQGLDLIAALAVNTPGYAARGRSDEQGQPLALVASLGPAPDADGGVEHLTRDAIVAAVKEAFAESFREIDAAALATERDHMLEAAGRVTHPPTPNEEIAAMLAGRNGVQ
jgi:hypothetical protein